MVDSTRSIRLPDDMWDKMRRLADANERSVGAEFRLAVKEYLSRHEAASRSVEKS
jgi:predicted transcriptional regulator